MSIVGIVVIVVVAALVLIGVFLLLPRFRERARVKKRELELRQRRKQVIGENREEAEDRERQAEEAERRARIAEQEARRERAEAQLRQEKASLHERGMADHELVEEHEREDFAGTSAVPGSSAQVGEEQHTSAYQEGQRAAQDPSRVEDFQAGRRDERDQSSRTPHDESLPTTNAASSPKPAAAATERLSMFRRKDKPQRAVRSDGNHKSKAGVRRQREEFGGINWGCCVFRLVGGDWLGRDPGSDPQRRRRCAGVDQRQSQ